ncbi:MAG: PA14 domain-containing protein [Oligoflexales bacterium]
MKFYLLAVFYVFIELNLYHNEKALGLENSNPEHGLIQKYYLGDWDEIPDFLELSAEKEQLVPSVNLGEYSSRSLNYFGLTFDGFLEIEFEGQYTFELTSDDGSKLYIDDSLIIDNNGLHGSIAKQNTIFLQRGLYPIRVEYFEKKGGQSLGLRYQYGESNLHEIPSEKFYIEIPPGHGINKGIFSKFYQGKNWSLLPDFEFLDHKSSETLSSIGLGSYSERSFDNFGLVLSGYLYIDDDAEYTFKLTSDDGSRLLFNNDLLINNDGIHGAKARISNEIFLSKGLYPIQIDYFEKSRGQTLLLEYRKGDGIFTGIPEQLLFHDLEDVPPPPPPKPLEKIVLPIEVIGHEGTKVDREIVLSPTQAEQASFLWLQVNNLGYQDKASVQINDGAWISLNHEIVQLEKQEAARGGMVHGGFNTIRFKLPLTESLLTGVNHLKFRFNFSDGISIGYRIIGLNLLDSAGTKVLGSSRFKMENPQDWTAPYSEPSQVIEGERLWKNGNLISNYLETEGNWYAYPIPPRQAINAKCADCHAQDGRDLEIFSYSNNSIIERSKFHGLSEEQGKLIASYIRSLSKENENVGRYGRPWNPPYQPGPKIADLPPEEWAAGAGLEAVLDEDRDMLLGMFGKTKNITRSEVSEYFDSDKMWDTSLQPLAIQLPDWKHWLPLIHPKDAFSRSNYYQNADKKYDPSKAYQKIRQYLGSSDSYTEKSLFHQLHQFWLHFRMFLTQGSKKPEHWRTTDGDPFTKGLKNGISKEMAATSLARLLAVKFFELHQEFKLEGIAAQLIDEAEQPRKRQWLGRQYNVFEVPAHFTACFKSGNSRCHHFEGQAKETGIYESTAWYQLQQVINPGIATSRDVVPVDYNYQPTLILRASETSDIKEPVRFYFSSNVMYQTRTRVDYFTPNDKEGFNMRTMGPWLFFGSDNRNNFEGLQVGEMPKLLNKIQAGLGNMIVDAQLEQFLKEMEKSRNSIDIWKRRTSSNKGEHKHLDPVNLSDQDMPNIDKIYSGKLRHYAHKIYWLIPRLINFGADCNLIDRVKDWSKSAWPRISWDQFDCQ